jgi:dephospho-CoA kinase
MRAKVNTATGCTCPLFRYPEYMNSSSPIRLGIVGQPSSGKDTVAAYLVDSHKFVHVSTGDSIRFYVAEHGLGEPTRELLRDIGNVLRAEHGPDYLARLALQHESDRLVISGLRTMAEAEQVKQQGGMVIAIEATLRHRYNRALDRGRVGEDVTFERFAELAEIEAQAAANNPIVQNVNAVVAFADRVITNDGTLKALHAQVDRLVGEMLA